MNTKPQISVDADALKQVLAALVGPGHLIRELQAIRGLPVLGGVTQDPIGTLITQFKEFQEHEVAAVQRPNTRDPFRDVFANVIAPSMPRVVAPRATEPLESGSEAESDREVGSLRLSEIATGAVSLVTGGALDERIEALLSNESPWHDVARNPPKDRIRVILASDDFVYGDCFFGRGSVRAGMANNSDYVAERAKLTWRYSSNEDALPPHFTPTQWQPLPDAPNKSIPRAGVKRVPKKLSP